MNKEVMSLKRSKKEQPTVEEYKQRMRQERAVYKYRIQLLDEKIANLEKELEEKKRSVYIQSGC